MLIATFIIKRRLKMTRKNIPGQVWEVVKPKGEVFNPQIQNSLIVQTRLGRFHSEGKNQMGVSYFANPTPNRKYLSVYPIDENISDKVPELFTNLGVVKSHGRREQ